MIMLIATGMYVSGCKDGDIKAFSPSLGQSFFMIELAYPCNAIELLNTVLAGCVDPQVDIGSSHAPKPASIHFEAIGPWTSGEARARWRIHGGPRCSLSRTEPGHGSCGVSKWALDGSVCYGSAATRGPVCE